MPVQSPVSAAVKAGALTGLAAGLAFAIAHLFIIKPVAILFLIAPVGGTLQGVAVGWAWHYLRLARPRLRGVVVGALYASALLPVGALAAVAECETEEGAAPECLRMTLAPPLLMLVVGAVLTRRPVGALAVGLAGGLLVFPIGAQVLASGEGRGIGWDTAFFVAILAILVGAGALLERMHRRLLAGTFPVEDQSGLAG